MIMNLSRLLYRRLNKENINADSTINLSDITKKHMNNLKRHELCGYKKTVDLYFVYLKIVLHSFLRLRVITINKYKSQDDFCESM